MAQCNFYVSDEEREFIRKEFPDGAGKFLRGHIQKRMREDPAYHADQLLEARRRVDELEAEAIDR